MQAGQILLVGVLGVGCATSTPFRGATVAEPGEPPRVLPPGAQAGPVVAPATIDDVRHMPTLSGRVHEADGSRAAAGARVEACGLSTRADERGWFRLQGDPLLACATVEARAVGGVATSASIELADNHHGTAMLTLPPPAAVLTVSGPEATLEHPDGATIALGGGQFRRADGSEHQGSVAASWVFLHDAEHMASAPGGLATPDGALRSFGMVGVELRDEAGQRLEYTGPATVRFPVSNGSLPPGPAPLYHWEPGGRTWTLAGQGEVSADGVFTAQVDGFSWWNCDQPAETRGCVTGRLELASGVDVSGAQVVGTNVSMGVVQSTSTRADGSFCLDLPEGDARIEATLIRDDTAWKWQVDTVVPGSGGTCGLDDCAVDLGALEPNSQRQTACFKGEVRQGEVDLQVYRREGWLVSERIVPVKGEFAFQVAWAPEICVRGHLYRPPNHGAAALRPGAFSSGCYDLGAFDPPPSFDTGSLDSSVWWETGDSESTWCW